MGIPNTETCDGDDDAPTILANWIYHRVYEARKLPPGVHCDDLLGFLRGKLTAAEQALRSREQAEKCWRGGTSKSWRKVGCKMTKAQRLLVSEKEGRIAEKCRRDVEMFRAVIGTLNKPNKEP